MSSLKKQILSIILLSLFLLLPSISSAIELNLTYPVFGEFDPSTDQDLNKLIAWFYYFIVAIAGFLAFFMLINGGFVWLTSAGNPSRIEEAKDLISSAILGLVIILASFLILQIINPELTTLRLIPLTPPQ